MSIWHFHFRPADGEIFGQDNNDNPVPMPDCEIATIEVGPDFKCVDRRLHKIDTVTFELADKTEAERRIALQPTEYEIRHIIFSALRASDEYMAPDRPLTTERRAQWVTYRQTLRDLSKPQDINDPERRPTPREMVDAYPLDPNGVDIMVQFRN